PLLAPRPTLSTISLHDALPISTLLLVNYIVVRFLYSHETLDRVIEGEPAVLIENGCLRQDCLKSELNTPAELKEAAHKQGFASRSEEHTSELQSRGQLVCRLVL